MGISLLKALHATVFVKFELDGVTKTLRQVIGVKQGDVLGPDLFFFFFFFRGKIGGMIRGGGKGMHRMGVGWRCGHVVVGWSDDYL